MRKLYQIIASTVQARRNCLASGNATWEEKHTDLLNEIARNRLPSGSGIDSGTKIDLEKSSGERIVLTTAFHHMNDCGMYDGWTEHTVTATPSFSGINLAISGRNRNEIKDYLAELFDHCLREECEQCQQCGTLLPHYPKGHTGGTGYATDSEGRKVCYTCCGEQDRKAMREGDRITLYLACDSNAPATLARWKVTNWPSTLVITPTMVSRGKHNIGRDRYDVWFTFEGEKWHGINVGDNQLLRCRKLVNPSAKYAVRILNADGTFNAYLSHKNRKEWSRNHAMKHIRESKALPHFAGLSFVLEIV